MSIIQSNNDLHYLNRKNLEEEARVIGGYYRDIINSYGINCTYFKLDTSDFGDFKKIIDQNDILRESYGYPVSRDYTISAKMRTYMDVQTDIFQLNKYGLIPNQDVTFYFDAIDYACAFAEKCGQLREFPVYETEIVTEIPEIQEGVDKNTTEVIQFDTTYNFRKYRDENKNIYKLTFLSADAENTKLSSFAQQRYLSSFQYPYLLGEGYNEYFYSEILSGKVRIPIINPKINSRKLTTVMAEVIEHSDALFEFPANRDLYKSLSRKITNSEYVDSAIYFSYRVKRVKDEYKKYKNVLYGKLHGKILFYDLNQLGKYVEIIKPNVGDVVTIDFPDESSKEQYEITQCIDKQLTQDGLNPLLHKYVWKCQAKRYVNGYEDAPEQNEANERVEELQQKAAVVKEEVAKSISRQDEDHSDAVYGGYELKSEAIRSYDKEDVRNNPDKEDDYIYLDENQKIDLVCFYNGTKLATDGYDLYFVHSNKNQYDNEAVKLTCSEPYVADKALFNHGLKFLKATDDCLIFVNILGESYKLAENMAATKNELIICLDSLYDTTYDTSNPNQNLRLDNFYKFSNTRTVIFSMTIDDEEHLYVRLASDKQLYRLD